MQKRILRYRRMAFLALLVVTPLYGQPAAETPSIQPEADEALKQMGQLLAEAEAFSFDAHITQDLPMAAGLKVQMYQHRRLVLSRPDKLWVEGGGDLDRNQAWFTGGDLSVYDPVRGVYAQINGPASIDGMLDHLALERGWVMPLSDLLVSDPYTSATQNVQLGLYLGEHEVRGTPCHHLVFRQDGIDWQVWIEVGDKPVPRKLLITFTDLAGQPQWSAELENWDLSPRLQAGVFEFEAPADAKQVDFDVFSGKSGQ